MCAAMGEAGCSRTEAGRRALKTVLRTAGALKAADRRRHRDAALAAADEPTVERYMAAGPPQGPKGR